MLGSDRGDGYEAGFARAINRGIRESSGELVMFCNADLFPRPYLVEMSVLRARARAGAAIGKILRYDLAADVPTGSSTPPASLLTRQRRFILAARESPTPASSTSEREVFAIDGAAMVMRRAALDEIAVDGEYLDENFVTHKEDHDVSWRVRLAGLGVLVRPDRVAYHGRTTRGLGATGYLSAVRSFHRNEQQKSLYRSRSTR